MSDIESAFTNSDDVRESRPASINGMFVSSAVPRVSTTTDYTIVSRERFGTVGGVITLC